MNIFTSLSKLALLLGACAISLPTADAYSQGKGKSKGKQSSETKGKHGREAGELPFGLEQRTDKKGELPSGLQKKKEGTLTHGLEEGGKGFKGAGKAKKTPK